MLIFYDTLICSMIFLIVLIYLCMYSSLNILSHLQYMQLNIAFMTLIVLDKRNLFKMISFKMNSTLYCLMVGNII